MRKVLALLALAFAATLYADDETNVIIEFERPPAREDLARLSKRAAIRQTYRHTFSGASVRVSRKSLPDIAALPNVKAIHTDYQVHALLDQSVPHIGAPKVWQQHHARGKGVVVAVIDSGVDYRHPALGGGFGPGYKVAGGWDFVHNDADPMDELGHGTHVAGIIAGDVDPVIGVAPDATLLAYKVLGVDAVGYDSYVLAAVERCMDPNGDGNTSDHADVVNISLGRRQIGQDLLVQAVERGAAAGIVFVIAAGNDGEAFTIHTPAVATSAITVGATDLLDTVASFSSAGPLPGTWQMKPEIAAPGVQINSADLNGLVTPRNGTSGAAPHVAGVAALILELHPDWTPADVKAAIVSTGRPILVGTSTLKPKMRAVAAGGGRLDALAAVEAVILPSPATLSFGIAGGTATRTLRLTNRSAGAQTLTLATTNVPEGATLTIEPASLSLESNASAEVKLTLTTTSGLPPTDDNLAISGNLEIAGGPTLVHVPWMAMSGNQIAVTYLANGMSDIYLSAAAGVINSKGDKPRTVTWFVPSGPVDVVVITQPEPGVRRRVIVREQQPVSGFTYLTVTPDEASLELDVAGVDERGVPLSSLGGERQIVQELVLPSGRWTEWASEIPPLFSTLKQTKLRTYEIAVRPAGDAYFAMHRVLTGLEKNETLTFDAGDWASQPLALRCEKPCDFTSSINFGRGVGYAIDLGAGTEIARTFHVTPSRAENVTFRAYLRSKRQGRTDGPRRKPYSLQSGGMRAEDGRLTFTLGDASSSVDYAPPRVGETVPLDSGPRHVRTTMDLVAGGWRVTAVPTGALGEDLADEAEDFKEVSLVDSTGKAVQWRQVQNPGVFITTALLSPDRYSLRLAVAGGTLTANFDTRKSNSAPSFASLRIEDSTRTAVSTLRLNDNARVHFSTKAGVVASETRAWWRPSGTTDWRPLTVSILEPTVFEADLHAATGARGEVDLRLAIADSLAATAEWVVERAFAVEQTKKRRAVR